MNLNSWSCRIIYRSWALPFTIWQLLTVKICNSLGPRTQYLDFSRRRSIGISKISNNNGSRDAWRKSGQSLRSLLHGDCTTISHAQTIPENFLPTVRRSIRDTYLEFNQVPNLKHILERLNQKKFRDFEHLNLFNRNEELDSDKIICISGRSAL